MVLVMEGDGSLSPSRSQSDFARNYNDGVGQSSGAAEMPLFGQPSSEEEVLAAVVVPQRVVPHPDILNGMEEIALRYAGHRGLRTADITVTDWLNLFRANIEIESAYRIDAVSHAGAIGLGQLMPDTARMLAVDPHDWRENLDGSARYLAMMLAEFGDVRLALAAYNAGPEAVREHDGIPPYRETQNHVSRVLTVFNRLEGATP
ncbi:lytic transglycosylase domain-containing protein [Pontivivens ytuae]|uniref:Lytic transglycosylase domain-containing protein n=1 Tax=Pontivivens ytuae TaxID=2789856 RepID=A0A7S9LWG2_9RHOB|nr:lytic transglycosylase domain-containing protein [Pontivivens ytuae]QPH56025.1 lytic transglycosylase domain-containing protein [Pontivivens ytuae]